eukprot:g43276.t1
MPLQPASTQIRYILDVLSELMARPAATKAHPEDSGSFGILWKQLHLYDKIKMDTSGTNLLALTATATITITATTTTRNHTTNNHDIKETFARLEKYLLATEA